MTLSDPAEAFRNRIRSIRERIDAAASRAGRQPGEVGLIAVSKTFPAEAIRRAAEAGLREFGESRMQEAAGKLEALSELDARWHLIGHLQRNKVNAAVGRFAMIHSVDSARLIEALERRAAALDVRQPILLQLNVAGEASKFGAPPEALDELVGALGAAPHLVCEGLMTIPPWSEDAEAARPHFARLRSLLGRLPATDNIRPIHLSMGMSGDFEAAVEEGATMVRVGTAIFGGRG
jgi:pyridoxal phosphate enzyme (YggS family)